MNLQGKELCSPPKKKENLNLIEYELLCSFYKLQAYLYVQENFFPHKNIPKYILINILLYEDPILTSKSKNNNK